MLISTSLWQIFTASLSGPHDGASIKTRAAHESALPARGGDLCGPLQNLFHALIQIALIAGTFIWFHIQVKPSMIFAPFALLALVPSAQRWGCFWLLLDALPRCGESMQIVTLVWLTITPVTYPYPHYAGLFADDGAIEPGHIHTACHGARAGGGRALTFSAPQFFLIVGIALALHYCLGWWGLMRVVDPFVRIERLERVILAPACPKGIVGETFAD